MAIADSGIQQPRFLLPLTEFFNLAPNASIALGSRLSQKVFSTTTPVPASGTANIFGDLTMIPQWGPSQGVYIVRAFDVFVPADATGSIQILAARMGLGSGSGNIFIDFGIPFLSFAAPLASNQILVEQQSLYTFRDMTQVGFPPGPLILSTATTVKNNDAGGPHSVTIQIQAIFHMLTGIVE